MRFLQASFVALSFLTAIAAFSRHHAHAQTSPAPAVVSADPVPLCPALACPPGETK